MRQTVVTVVKLALALGILSYLVVTQRDAFAQLWEQPPKWPFLAGALFFTFAMVTLSFLRWHVLILALGFDVRLVRTLRLGAVGFVMNFVSAGSIGGDFFKAIFLAHDHPEHRTEAIATIVADRVMGLLTMLLMASVGILATGLLDVGSPAIKALSQGMVLMTAICWLGCTLLLLVGGLSGAWMRSRAETIPIAGDTISRLLGTVAVYRGQKKMLTLAFGVSLLLGVCYVTSYYLMARGLPADEPSYAQHFVIVPVAGLVGSIPITPNGWGTTEETIKEMYETLPGGTPARGGRGFLVSIGRRVTDIVVAIVGMMFYLSQRREVREVYAEAQELSGEHRLGEAIE